MPIGSFAQEKTKLTGQTNIRYLKGVGPKKQTSFTELGINKVQDLLYYFPFRYQDRRNIKKIKDLVEDEFVVVQAKIMARRLKKIPYFVKASRVRDILEIVIQDNTGSADLVWFNQGYLFEKMNIGQEIMIFGKPQRQGRYWKFNSPEYQIFETDQLNPGKIVGIYSLPKIFTQKFIRGLIAQVLLKIKPELTDSLPYSLREKLGLVNISQALTDIHFPETMEAIEFSRNRFIFEELFFSQVLVYLRKAKHTQIQGVKIDLPQRSYEKFIQGLGFELTLGQAQAIEQIRLDLAKTYPMHRLLQGDVGCGKTVVAGFSVFAAISQKHQAAIMVPTEILAFQHLQTFRQMFKQFDLRVEVLTSSLPDCQVQQIYQDLANGSIDLIVGTHALLHQAIEFKNLSMVVIDEQHKFGVAQQALLPKKGIPSPHCLVMSATPIPRSLALSLYGDLDLSVIKQMPAGRKPPENKWVKSDQRDQVYDFIEQQLSQGRQAYFIYPMIEETLDQDVKSLQKMHEKLAKRFGQYKVGMFHGRLNPKEKLKIVEEFNAGKIHVLAATTVVEVGVNVANASVMVVESPERFGLAQLHQLRGRIQRSNHQPYFFVLSENNLSENSIARIKAITENNDGFLIAEQDLKLRGPGDFFGQVQHGLPDLKIADPQRDLKTLKLARVYAYKTIKSDHQLLLPQNRCIRQHLDFWFQGQVSQA